MTTTQTDSGHGNVTATAQNTTTPSEFPDEQERSHQGCHSHEENEVLTFDFGTASTAKEDAPSTLTCLAILYVNSRH